MVGEPRSDGSAPRNAVETPPEPEVMERLRTAVFEDGATVHQLRTEFDPLVRPKKPAEERLDALKRTGAAARRLLSHLEGVEGLPDADRARVVETVQSLQAQMEALAEPLKQELAAAQSQVA